MVDVPSPDQAPSIPPQVRSIAYYVSLCAGAAGTMAIGITAIVAPGAAVAVAGVVGVVLGGIATIAGGLGVAYRPTAGPRP